ncbi:MAG: transketolase C-terminal domain-containing protein, partial [Candidatus Altiarchaeota archaeon]
AAGLALSGNIVYTYTFANFTVLRCLEQIRNDACYHKANVKILGVGSGLTYGSQGMTHHGTEDLAAVGALPNMTVFCPADPVETELAVRAAAKLEGPCYIQLRKSGEEAIHAKAPAFKIGKAIRVRGGKDVTLLGTGWITHNLLKAADLLEKDGISAGVLSFPTLKPFDEASVRNAAKVTHGIVTVEENTTEFLGKAAAKALVTGGCPAPLLILSLGEGFPTPVGCQEYMLRKAGLDPEGIRKAIKRFIKDKIPKKRPKTLKNSL